MAARSTDIGPYDALLDRVMIELRHLQDNFMYWVQHLSDSEKLVGMCMFVFVLMLLMVNRSRREDERKPIGSGRQFSTALLLVVVFAFGAGWMLDSSGADFSYLFDRWS